MLPAIEATRLDGATVVVTFFDDPKQLHVRYITQQQAGLQPIFVSRIRARDGTIVALVAANAILAVLGAGLLPWLRLAHTRRRCHAPAARLRGGIAAGGILVAHLSLLHIPLGRIGLPLLAAVRSCSGCGGCAARRPGRRAPAAAGRRGGRAARRGGGVRVAAARLFA